MISGFRKKNKAGNPALFLLWLLFANGGCIEKAGEFDSTQVIDFESLVLRDFTDLLGKSELKMVPLETSPGILVGDYNLFRKNGENYYLFSQQDGRIHRFDKNGTFLNSIGEVGVAPGEYHNPISFIVKGEQVYVLSNEGSMSQIHQFKKTGEFIGKMAFEESTYYDLEMLENDLIFSTGSNPVFDNKYKLHVRSNKGESLKEFYPIEKRNLYSLAENNFHRYGKSVFYNESFNNDVFVVNPEGIKKTYSVNFGKYNLREDAFEGHDALANFDKILANGIGLIRSYFESEELAYLNLVTQQTDKATNFYHLFLDKKNGELNTFEALSGRAPAFEFINDNTIVLLIHPGDLLEYAGKHKEAFGEYEGLLGKMDINDNPVVMELKLNL